MISMFKFGAGLLLFVIALSGCIKDGPKAAPRGLRAPAVPADRVQFQEGLKAFYKKLGVVVR